MAVDGSTEKSPGVRTHRVIVLATAVLVATWVVLWLAVVPVGVACPAIYPAPPGCSAADRRSAGVTWSLIVTMVYALSVTIALTFGRGRRWLTHGAVWALVLVAVIGIGAVQGSTGIWY
ncbi:hypothetical protein M3148_16840 [Georgenia satyanarayanai]|uniref:hypothetical protein n=1 Tax=Georgenia satyanarayanai TaxID=860221 RepID=UPI00203BA732|nr:hypothetical protein [Georgenia satyanarayanai]MCM3662640.1 hypothetical protein [Georgenia satyanarayanai]